MNPQPTETAKLSPTNPDFRIAVIVLNYRTPELALEAARSAALDVDPKRDIVVIVDNASPDGSAEILEDRLKSQDLSHIRLIRSPRNGGFAAGNNVGIRDITAQAYVLLNSDTIVRPGAMETLFSALLVDDSVGLVSPLLCGIDDDPQISCFRFMGLVSEFIRGVSTGAVTRLLRRYEVPLGVKSQRCEVPWTSFACVMIHRRVFEQVGLLDEGYFMYFEDADYCRTARQGGFRVVHEPAARVVHLRGKSSPVKDASRLKKRRPSYYYEARARYFLRGYGPAGLMLANLAWTLGILLVLPRQIIGQKEATLMEGEFLDNWRGKGPAFEANS